MKLVFNRIVLLLGAIALAGGVLLLFFGGNLYGVRFALELFGAFFVLQLAYKVVTNKE